MMVRNQNHHFTELTKKVGVHDEQVKDISK